MYGKWVEVSLGEDFQVKVWISCTPETDETELLRRAREKLIRSLGA